jgi:hypothetical protein
MKKPSEPKDEQLSVSHAFFRPVYEFILRVMQGDTAAASAMFQRYLAGELPVELLSLSRRCVQEDQRGRRTQRAIPRKPSYARRPVGSRTSATPSTDGGAMKVTDVQILGLPITDRTDTRGLSAS